MFVCHNADSDSENRNPKEKARNMVTHIVELETRHGRQLLAIFPDSAQADPVKLCKRLRQHERSAKRAAVRYCNGEIDMARADMEFEIVLDRVKALLGSDRVWINRDPRGYALKIDLRDGEELHRDWGGYGIIAPDLTA